MKILTGGCDPVSFFNRLSRAAHRLLLLDYDGTLAPFNVRKDRAYPYPEIPPLLDRIMEDRRTRLVIISGRALEDLTPLLHLSRRPELWGSHGGERLLPDGSYLPLHLDDSVRNILKTADREIESKGWKGRLEKKPSGLALHWRGLSPEKVRTMRREAEKIWSPFTSDHGLQMREFDGGLELRAAGIDKGRSVKTLLDESPPGTVAAYLGDDLTDEDAFRAVKGRGLAVLVRNEPRPTAADIWLKPPDELLEFLECWVRG
jgi:trehalose 6-phosphate phosphatase